MTRTPIHTHTIEKIEEIEDWNYEGIPYDDGAVESLQKQVEILKSYLNKVIRSHNKLLDHIHHENK